MRKLLSSIPVFRFTSTSQPSLTTRFPTLTLWERNIGSNSCSNNCRPTIMKSGKRNVN